jgi:hypothetical protein
VPKSLLATNPYLRDPKVRRVALEVSAASSSAVEGIRKPFAKPKRDGSVESVVPELSQHEWLAPGPSSRFVKAHE